SRRRHTRSKRDWSSDVCSSDLEPINSIDENYIMRKIREEHLKDSTITLVLIGERSYEKGLFYENQTYIKRELQASLYDIPNGIEIGRASCRERRKIEHAT